MTQISAGKSTGGVLQIPIAATQKNTTNTATAPAPKKAPKPVAPRLKLLVRRLPPGLTQAEFETAVGPEWKIGAGKIDWIQYKPGKVSKDPAKPSRPSRAYVHVVSSDHIIPFSNKVRQVSFTDARNTFNDPILLGPPSVEYAPYAKIPGSRVRKDARQGTIDQDPDFIAFLESLTQPITKPPTVENTTDADEKKETVTTTPLVQYIKEKKANKAKESSSKSSKHAKADKETKAEKVQAKKLLQRPDKETAQAPEKNEKKSKADKATKDAVRAANKQAANVAKHAAKASAVQNSPKDTGQSTPTTERRRERGSAAAAAKILQRDLGLAPSGGRRKGGKGGSAETDASKAEATSAESGKKETPPKSSRGGASSQNAKAKGNVPQVNELTSQSETNTPPASTTPISGKSSKSKGKQAPPAASTSTQAFLKHANPSQGVTEPLLEAAFKTFGKVVKVEIDKKKGFGYIDFAEPDGLQKAIAASPVSVAQSQVVVLERKINPGGEKGRGKNRNEPQATSANGNNNSSNSNTNGGRGGKVTEGGSGSSRGRGGRSKKGGGGGGKGSGGNANANAPEGTAKEAK
ncbi:nonsense-mediated mRNA decay protein Upf3 [Aspergillus nomiae NRRL 13137]|uniref:Nonsense-mediated mRNA decay protein Upf3 n=1 Tax=Aspergillus nomiae NRRL (strain ATCC 15546 / NRRL 13137 / CBS 260.88 / M93) TaxID=1509407 RepID=A0A0L1J5Y7_ASPN3|nr:nonsense-mediated mRNA decay protein Upf3 [Aspergillus nomiae NRRL 13137]KNG87154.1 nonsense-mediated mRNA decay protein Upf3 [Aspergillus nomiae NRRL 13137]